MTKFSRKINRFLLVLGAILLAFIIIQGFVSATLHWQGVCLVESGRQEPCSWIQFALREISWGIFLFIPYFFLAALLYLAMALTQLASSLAMKFLSKK